MPSQEWVLRKIYTYVLCFYILVLTLILRPYTKNIPLLTYNHRFYFKTIYFNISLSRNKGTIKNRLNKIENKTTFCSKYTKRISS